MKDYRIKILIFLIMILSIILIFHFKNLNQYREYVLSENYSYYSGSIRNILENEEILNSINFNSLTDYELNLLGVQYFIAFTNFVELNEMYRFFYDYNIDNYIVLELIDSYSKFISKEILNYYTNDYKRISESEATNITLTEEEIIVLNLIKEFNHIYYTVIKENWMYSNDYDRNSMQFTPRKWKELSESLNIELDKYIQDTYNIYMDSCDGDDLINHIIDTHGK